MPDALAQLGPGAFALAAAVLVCLAGLLWLQERRQAGRDPESPAPSGPARGRPRPRATQSFRWWARTARLRAADWTGRGRSIRRRRWLGRMAVPALSALVLALGLGIALREQRIAPQDQWQEMPRGAGIVGQAQAIDGDTLVLAGRRIRLHGVDAPEYAQSCERNGMQWACGAAAAAALGGFLRGRRVVCTPLDTDSYGRTVARCEADGHDVGAWLVREGFAVAYRQYSSRYLPEETMARSQRRGIWAGSFLAPSDYRRSGR